MARFCMSSHVLADSSIAVGFCTWSREITPERNARQKVLKTQRTLVVRFATLSITAQADLQANAYAQSNDSRPWINRAGKGWGQKALSNLLCRLGARPWVVYGALLQTSDDASPSLQRGTIIAKWRAHRCFLHVMLNAVFFSTEGFLRPGTQVRRFRRKLNAFDDFLVCNFYSNL